MTRILRFRLHLNCYVLIAICTFIFSGKHRITSKRVERNHFHRLINSSYYVLVHNYNHAQIDRRIVNYLNNDRGNTLPHTTVESSKFGIDKERPWLSNDPRIKRNNAKAEEEVDGTLSRAPEFSIGNFTLSSVSYNSLSTSKCGISSRRYIVGGRQAPPGSQPWTAAILVSDKMWCSCTIINKWWVVTAAHAFENIGTDPSKVTISVGNTDRTKGKIYRITKIIPHARYDVFKFKSSDIALMKVDGPIVMGQDVRPICLPGATYQDVHAEALIVAGWGFTAYGSNFSPAGLRNVQLTKIPIERCAQIYSDIKYKIYKSQICTWNEGQDACQGDSGGPAIEYINGRATLVGIVSYGVTCADKYPGVFTKVSYFINWINNAIRNN